MNNIIKASYFNDFCYTINKGRHGFKTVCFKFVFTKRVKTKVKALLKNKDLTGLTALGVRAVKTRESNKYIHYDVVDI